MRSAMKQPRGERIAAAMASVVLHGTVLAFLAGHTMQVTRIEQSPPAVHQAPLIATAFLFDDVAKSQADNRRLWLEPALESAQSIDIPVPPSPPEFDAAAADSFEEGRQVESLADVQEIKRLQGIYVKQISDRVARVLEMSGEQRLAPETPCVVHVIQNESGDVVDVDTDECEREPRAQQRLASAIWAASPLPMPPQGLAMGSYLTLDATSL